MRNVVIEAFNNEKSHKMTISTSICKQALDKGEQHGQLIRPQWKKDCKI